MRLIDADAERERLKKGYCEECTRKGNYGIFGAACTPCWVKDAIEEFDNAQEVKAEPVRRGRWIQSDALDYKDPNGVIHVHGMCSCCRLIYDFRDMTSRFKFCPNCGARMDGGASGCVRQ